MERNDHMVKQVVDYLQNNRDNLLKRLHDYLAIPSVSTDSTYNKEVKNAARFTADYLTEIGFSNVEQIETAGHPLVDRKSTRLNSSHVAISYAVFCLKKKK